MAMFAAGGDPAWRERDRSPDRRLRIGYISPDFHLHANYSFDSTDTVDLKVRAAVAEGLEIPVSSEHEYVLDFGPVVERLGLSRELPLMDRFAALKGLNIGITQPGAVTDVIARYYLKQAGLDPDRDAPLVPVGGAAALAAGTGRRWSAWRLRRGLVPLCNRNARGLGPPGPSVGRRRTLIA